MKYNLLMVLSWRVVDNLVVYVSGEKDFEGAIVLDTSKHNFGFI